MSADDKQKPILDLTDPLETVADVEELEDIGEAYRQLGHPSPVTVEYAARFEELLAQLRRARRERAAGGQ